MSSRDTSTGFSASLEPLELPPLDSLAPFSFSFLGFPLLAAGVAGPEDDVEAAKRF